MRWKMGETKTCKNHTPPDQSVLLTLRAANYWENGPPY